MVLLPVLQGNNIFHKCIRYLGPGSFPDNFHILKDPVVKLSKDGISNTWMSGCINKSVMLLMICYVVSKILMESRDLEPRRNVTWKSGLLEGCSCFKARKKLCHKHSVEISGITASKIRIDSPVLVSHVREVGLDGNGMMILIVALDQMKLVCMAKLPVCLH